MPRYTQHLFGGDPGLKHGVFAKRLLFLQGLSVSSCSSPSMLLAALACLDGLARVEHKRSRSVEIQLEIHQASQVNCARTLLV